MRPPPRNDCSRCSKASPTAFGVSEGHKAKVDPHVWKIVDGKLYLNYDAGVGTEWRKDIPGRIAKADQNWPKVMKD